MSDLDLLLTVGVDKDALVRSFVNGMKEAQKEAEKETVTYKLKADKNSFLSEIKSLLSSTPDLNKDIILKLDDSSFKKGLDDIEKYTGKKASSITRSFRGEFQNSFKNNPLNLDNLIEGNKSEKKVKEKVKNILDELSKYSTFTKDGGVKELDLSKVSDYKDLEKVVNLTKELDAILKQTGEKGYKVNWGDKKLLEESVKNLQSGYGKAMVQFGNSYKSQLESMKSDTTDVFSQLQQLLLNVFLGVQNDIKETSDDIGNSISDGIGQGVIDSQKKLDDLEKKLDDIKKKKQDLQKGINQQDLYDNLDKARKKVDDALLKGDAVKKEDAIAYVKAMTQLTNNVAQTKNNPKWEEAKNNYDAVKGELGKEYIPTSKMETRLSLLQKINEEERQLEIEINKEKQAINEANQERAKTKNIASEQEVVNEKENVESKEQININKEKIISEINEISEKLKELSNNKTEIEIAPIFKPDFINDLQNQLNSIQNKPSVEVEAKFVLPSNKDDISIIDSQKYVDNLKSKYNDIVSYKDGVNFFKGLGTPNGLEEATRMEGIINDILQQYPELKKIQNVFDNNNYNSFIDSDEWNKFLSTLPQAQKYLESINYSFDKNQDLGLQTEIQNLEGLQTLLDNIIQSIKNKTKAFEEENQTVGTISTSESESLGKIQSIIDNIKEAIEKLHDSEKSKIELSPKLSNNFETQIQELLNEKEFIIKLTPTLSDNELLKSDDILEENDNYTDINNKKKKQLSKEEKEYNKIITQARKEFLNGNEASTQTKNLLDNALKQMVAVNEIDAGELYDILKDDITYTSKKYGSNYVDIRKYIRSKKIKYSDTDRAEFGDDWKDLENTLGRNLRKNEGIDPEILLRELAGEFSEITDEGVSNTQEALHRIYDYLKNTPEEYADKMISEMSSYKDEQIALDNKKISEITKNAVVPRNYLGELNADSLEQYDDINSSYAAELEKEQIEMEKLIESHRELNELRFNSESPILSENTNNINQETEANLQLADSMDKVDKERTDNETSQVTTESANAINEEAKAMSELFDKAIKAAEAKKQFVNANHEVLSSIIESLKGLNSEGNGFSNLNKLINNLANNKDDRIKNLILNLRKIRDALSKPIEDNAFINSIRDIANQGDNLKDLASVLKTSKKEIKNAQKSINKESSKSKSLSIFDKDKKSAENNLSKLSERINKLGNEELINELNQINLEFNNIGENADKLNEVTQSIEILTAKTQSAENEATTLANNAKTITENYKELAKRYNELKSPSTSNESVEIIQGRINELKAENAELEKNNYTKQQSEAITKAKTNAEIAEKNASEAISKAKEREVTNTEKAATAEERATIAINSSRISLLNQASALRNNGKLMAVFGDEVNEMISELSNTGIADSRLTQIKDRLREIQAEANQTGKSGSSFWQVLSGRFQSLAAYLGSFASFYKVVEVIRRAYTNVQELNFQMVELAKVSEQSLDQIKGDFEDYATTAKNLGATISDTISATADWARLGYNVPDSKQLAEVALLYKNVGDGIDINSANESLISTLQGFKLEAKDAMQIIDAFNEVANTEAISSAGIGEALQRSAASLNAANTSLNESIALVAATNAVTQNPEKVGTMWRTVSARIRGSKAELEEMGEETDGVVESTSRLRDLVKGMTGFDIMEDENTYKSIYDIIVGIGQKWKELDDIDRAALLESLAGKNRSNELAAALNNVEGLTRAYETAENSAGSAIREQENFEQGLEYSTNKMRAALEELSADALNSDFLKSLIDTGTNAIEIFDKLISDLGLLKTAFIGAATVIGSQKLG